MRQFKDLEPELRKACRANTTKNNVEFYRDDEVIIIITAGNTIELWLKRPARVDKNGKWFFTMMVDLHDRLAHFYAEGSYDNYLKALQGDMYECIVFTPTVESMK